MDSTPPTFNLGTFEEIFSKMNSASDEDLAKMDMGTDVVNEPSTQNIDRFPRLSDNDVDALVGDATSKNTKKQTKFSVVLLKREYKLST